MEGSKSSYKGVEKGLCKGLKLSKEQVLSGKSAWWV